MIDINKLKEHLGFFWTDDWNDEIVHFFSRVKDIWGIDYSLPNSF